MNATNPLLDFSDLPRFDLVQPEHVKPAIESLLTAGRELIERLTAATTPATWRDFAGALADGLEPFGRAWGIVGHLHSVNDVPAWREAYNEMLPEVSRFYAELGQNLKLFEKYKALRASSEYATLTREQQKVVANEIRDFRLSGAELPEDQKPRFQAISEELSQLSAKFSENLLDATNAFAEIVTDEAQLAGLPDDAKQAARNAAEKAGVAGWRFSLQAPSYGPVMQYADESRTARPDVPRLRHPCRRIPRWQQQAGMGQHAGHPAHARIASGRSEDARLSPTSPKSRWPRKWPTRRPRFSPSCANWQPRPSPLPPGTSPNCAPLRRDEVGIADFQPWDAAYVSEKLLQKRYAFSEQEVKQYFTEPKVLGGLFKVIESLFKVKVKPDDAPVWHEDVRFYRLETPAGDLVGQFYLDLYARETKRGGAWMDEARARRRTVGGIQKPIAYLNCNFARPVGERDGKPLPATFTHDEVITLFHETGHGLHHLLTRGEELGVSGIHGVEWDAVELPSQFMENYCWEWNVLQGMTAHVDSGAPLPRELFDKMLAAKNFQSGMMAVRQIEFSLFDMLLHSEFDPQGRSTVMDLLGEVRREVAVLIPPEWHRFPNSFSHIFGGGYGAGYFSYKWAEVLSADAYAAFEEAGDPFDATVGQRFLDEILSVGGSRPAIESFKAFRGREPSVDALLRHSGMIAA